MILDNKKHLLILGCSFTVSTYKTFGEIISEKYDLKLHNLGIEGGTNPYIIKKTYEWFTKNKNKIHDTFVIIAWTHPQRRMYWNNKQNEWLNDTNHIHMRDTDRFKEPFINTTWTYKERQKFCINFLNNTYAENNHYMEHIINLQSFLISNKIDYIMFNSLWDMFSDGKSPYQAEMIIDTDWDEIGERPNLNRELWDNFVDKDTFYLKIFHDMIGEDKSLWYSENDNHPNDKSHKLWSEKLIKFIEGVYV